MAGETEELAIGVTAGPWRVERELGRGGMSVVYAVVHKQILKRAALKILHRDSSWKPEWADRVYREAQAVNAVGHPNIVDIFEAGLLPDGRPYLVMERLDGVTLAERAAEDRLAPDYTIALLLQLCDALVAAHARGVIHRDLKLDNVFLVGGASSDVPRVKLLDWGIAKILDDNSRRTMKGQVLGTAEYISPEQARGGSATPKSDVYSLGVMAYELLLGLPPFEAESATELLRKHLDTPPPAPSELWPQIPLHLEALLLAMLAKDPADRPTMRDVSARLEVGLAEIARRRHDTDAIVAVLSKHRSVTTENWTRPPTRATPSRLHSRLPYALAAILVGIGLLVLQHANWLAPSPRVASAAPARVIASSGIETDHVAPAPLLIFQPLPTSPSPASAIAAPPAPRRAAPPPPPPHRAPPAQQSTAAPSAAAVTTVAPEVLAPAELVILYERVGRAIKVLQDRQGQEATRELWPRFRLIHIYASLQTIEDRRATTTLLRQLEREITSKETDTERSVL